MTINIATLIAYLIALAIPIASLWIIRQLDLFNSTRMRTLIICVLWGAVGAFGLSYVINNFALRTLLEAGISSQAGYETIVRLIAPIIEEILKAAMLLYLIRRPEFRYFVDGAIYGFCVGIGFAVMENYFYIANSGNAALTLAISRVLSTSLMHAMASALMGIALGRLRRATGRSATFLPVTGIIIAIAVHVLYNNIVNTIDQQVVLLLLAISFGVGGAGFIGLQIQQGLNAEKKRFGDSLGISSDVSTGERMAIQRLGGSGIESMMADLQNSMGEENVLLMRRLLITQANIGILRNNLNGTNVSPRLRKAWEDEIAERQAEFQQIRKELGRTVMSFMQSLFPTEDDSLWNLLQQEMGASDPTMVHTFDMFMRTAGLSSTFTAEQLEDIAERLHKIDIFREVSLADLENLARAVEIRTYPDNAMLFDQGDAGDAMYLIESGGITIYSVEKGSTGDVAKENKLRTFTSGSVVGDFAVLDGQPRSARARAADSLNTFVLQREMFRMFIQSRPQVILAVLKVLADKARFTTTTVENSVRMVTEIAQGHYDEVARLGGTTGPAVAAADVAQSDSADAEALQQALKSSTASLKDAVAQVAGTGGGDVVVEEASSDALDASINTALTKAFARFANTLQAQQPAPSRDE